MDAAETFWQEWVLGYDLGQQGLLADSMQQSGRIFGLRWFDQLREMCDGLGAAAGDARGAALRRARWRWCSRWRESWLWLAPRTWHALRVRRRVRRARQGQASLADATLLYPACWTLLRRRGYQKPAWFTPRNSPLRCRPHLRRPGGAVHRDV